MAEELITLKNNHSILKPSSFPSQHCHSNPLIPITNMTTYIPSLTLPSYILANPAYATLLPIAFGTAVGFSTRPTQTQATYAALRQPPFRPPPWVFGPAWTALYGLMGYASFRAWTNGINSFDVGKVKMAKVRDIYTGCL